jgi:hypothetical protein
MWRLFSEGMALLLLCHLRCVYDGFAGVPCRQCSLDLGLGIIVGARPELYHPNAGRASFITWFAPPDNTPGQNSGDLV